MPGISITRLKQRRAGSLGQSSMMLYGRGYNGNKKVPGGQGFGINNASIGSMVSLEHAKQKKLDICACGIEQEPIDNNPSLPLFSIIDTDVKQDNTTVEIKIGYSSHRFSGKSKVTHSDQKKTSDFNNILLVGSETIQTNPSKTISLKYGLPLIIYRKGKKNSTNFINNLNENFNFHPHGLACDAFVDGASALNEFGPSSALGDTISLKYPIVNNSMFSAWHPHPMFNSSPLLYGNLIMPYIVKDKFSDLLEPYFTLNQNDIPIAFSTIDCDNSGKLNSARLYSYPCVNLRVHKTMKDVYPNISSSPIENNDNLINYCSSLGAWRGTFLQINGQITGAYTPNNFCQGLHDSCANSLFCSTPECTNQYTQLLTHEVNHNLLRLRLVHTGSSFRRSYFGFIGDNNNFLDFWVIGGGSGFDTPWKTKMVSLQSMNRADVIIDITQQKSKAVYLVTFDFDITLMEKVILFQPYLETNPDLRYNKEFFKQFSIYTGCRVDNGVINNSIFNNKDCLDTFLDLLNKLRSPANQTNVLPYFKTVKFNYKKKTHKLVPVTKIVNIIKKILVKPNKYYFNYPEERGQIRRIAMSPSETMIQVDSWIKNTDTPSLMFKFTDKSTNHENVNMINNTLLIVKELDDAGIISHTYNITFSHTTEPITITKLTNIINNEFNRKGIKLKYAYSKKTVDINDEVKINSVFIHIHNTGNKKYRLEGNNNIMQIMGIEYKWRTSDITSAAGQSKKTDFSIFLSNREDSNLVTLTQHPNHPTMGNVHLTIPPNSSHSGNPFQVMNDNIMNFSVKSNSSEKWIFYNTDDIFFDNHPLHFHLTNGFVDQSKKISSHINNHPSLGRAMDQISIKAGTHIAFDLKFSDFDSSKGTITHLGYMFHCHYMMHHDMNMMGQFYVEP